MPQSRWSVFHAEDIDGYDWGPKHDGLLRPINTVAGVSGFGLSQVELPPGAEGFEHDEIKTGQEEVYVILRGTGSVRLDGETVPVREGDYVLVPPDVRRRVIAGEQGLAFCAIGGPEGWYRTRDA